MWTWGNNADGQLGDGTDEESTNPTPVCALGEEPPCDAFLDTVAAVATGSFHALALTQEGELLAWGDNDFGQLGNDNVFDSSVPLLVAGYPEDADPAPTAEGPCAHQSVLDLDGACVIDDGGRAVCAIETGCLNLRDDAYDGTSSSMRCMHLVPTISGTMNDVQATFDLDHGGAGDLVIRLVHPDGTVVTLLNRPGLAETVDDGSEPGGSTAPLSWDWPITFAHGAATSAELMGPDDGVICKDTSPCEFAPSAGAATPGHSLDALDGKNSWGDWLICIGDAGDHGLGGISRVSVSWAR